MATGAVTARSFVTLVIVLCDWAAFSEQASWQVCGVKKYFYLSDPSRRSFDDARAHCQSLNGDLAMPKSDDEQNCIHRITPGISWIGIRRPPGSNKHDKNSFKYLDGTSLFANRWLNKQPGNTDSNEECVTYWIPTQIGGWADEECWLTHFPLCQKIVTCPHLNPPTNGFVSANWNTYQSVIRFSCSTGYNLQGSGSRTCQADGSWSGTTPSCSIATCPSLSAPSNGQMSGNGYTYQSVTTFSCQPGYNLSGSTSRTCQANGSWSGATAYCSIVQCTALSRQGATPNVTTANYNTNVTYTCSAHQSFEPFNYKDNSRVVKCMSNGTMAAFHGQCQTVNCNVVSKNGALPNVTVTSYNKSVAYTCPIGHSFLQKDYKLSNKTVRCLSNNTMEEFTGKCLRVICNVFPDGGGTPVGNVTTVLFNETVVLACGTGYSFDQNDYRKNRTVVKCLPNQSMRKVIAPCQPVNCPLLSAPTNGVMTGFGRIYQTALSFGCSTGFDLEGSHIRRCQPDGHWSGTIASCSRSSLMVFKYYAQLQLRDSSNRPYTTLSDLQSKLTILPTSLPSIVTNITLTAKEYRNDTFYGAPALYLVFDLIATFSNEATSACSEETLSILIRFLAKTASGSTDEFVPYANRAVVRCYGPCPVDTTVDGTGNYTWPITNQSKLVEIECTKNRNASARRSCFVSVTSGSYWDFVNSEDCDFVDGNSTSANLKSLAKVTVNSSSAVEVSLHLQKLTLNSTSSLHKHDLKNIVKVIDNLEDVLPTLSADAITEVFRNIVPVVSVYTGNHRTVILEAQRENKTSSRLLQNIRSFEEQLINSSLLLNSSAQVVVLDSPNFMVAASTACPTINISFPGKSFRLQETQSKGNLQGTVDEAKSINLYLDSHDSLAIVNLPENFAPIFESNVSSYSIKSKAHGSCSEPVAVIFHAVKNAKLFQSVLADPNSVTLPSEEVVLGEVSSVINSVVVSAIVLSQRLDTSLLQTEMEFLLAEIIKLNSAPHCSFWIASGQDDYGEWSDEGCRWNGSVGTRHLCKCNHMTNFAILMDANLLQVKQLPTVHKRTLTAITYVGCALSTLGLLLAIATILTFRHHRVHTGKQAMACLAISLISLYVFFLVAIEMDLRSSSCFFAAIAVHFAVLSSFNWMFVQAVYTYLALHRGMFRLATDVRVGTAAIFSWGVPGMIVAITAGANPQAYEGKVYCRIETPTYYYSFFVPVLTVLIANMALLLKCMWFLFFKYKSQQAASTVSRKRNQTRVLGLAGLAMLYGIPWLLAVPMFDEARLPFQYIFAILNSLQGLFIFIFQFAMKEEVRKDWRKELQKSLDILKERTRLTSLTASTSMPPPTSTSPPTKTVPKSQTECHEEFSTSSRSCTPVPTINVPTLGTPSGLFSEVFLETNTGDGLVQAMMY